MSEESENIIDVIEQRLRQLELEKDQIEKIYGINEDLIKEYTTSNNLINAKENININNRNSKLHSYTNTNNLPAATISKKNYYASTNIPLPKLENTNKKEINLKNTNYKTPESLQDSLKYEPNIKDLLDQDDLEPDFKSINNLKTNPFIPKSSNISEYIDDLNDDYFDNHIN
jgi:hypothetical protein